MTKFQHLGRVLWWGKTLELNIPYTNPTGYSNLGNSQRNRLSNPIVTNLQFQPKALQEPCNDSASLQGSRWPSDQNRYNAVIKIALVRMFSQ